jgi:uncharacterized membrane protein
MSAPSTSLAAAITTHVRRRILLVAAGFLSVVIGLAVFEILKVLASLEADVAQDADMLRAAVASELLVNNEAAVPMILAEANRQSSRWQVGWTSGLQGCTL